VHGFIRILHFEDRMFPYQHGLLCTFATLIALIFCSARR
jgi:hypothetical protein